MRSWSGRAAGAQRDFAPAARRPGCTRTAQRGRYPNVLRRYLGTLLDGVLLFSVLLTIAKIGVTPESERWFLVLFCTLVLLYEPIFTVYSCTLGQALMRMRVRDEKTLRRISVSQAYNRVFVKYFLGWISFLTLPFQQRRQAVHDLFTNTLVIEARDAAKAVADAPAI